MIKSRVCLLVFLFFHPLSSGFAEDPALSPPLSGYERQLHLLQNGEAPVMPAGLAPLQSAPEGKKSAGLAAVYSLLLPGMGELYADGFSSGKYFLIADGLLWLTYAAFEVSGNSLRDDSRAFAVSRAGVDPSGKDDQYYVDIGNFLDIYEYNEKQLRDRDPEELYDPDAGYAWAWDSDASRATYREQRIDSETMYNNKKFVVAGLIANRVASAINAVRSVIAYNDAIDEALGDLSFRADVLGGLSHPHGVMLTVTRSF
jgi:hypothetical protein